jgi:4-diphosphocytidyl-2-C-methyl-D-erythritol kinase
MMPPRELAPGKVNLCLFLGPVRADGRHELVTLFEPVSLYDELVVTPAGAPGDSDQVVCAGVDGPNLVADALAGLRARGWEAPPVRVEITKRIPVAGGMGGGSADAAAVLQIAHELEPVALDDMVAIAAELGADVPAALIRRIAVGTGAGDAVASVLALADHAFAIVPLPGQQLSTAAVYAEADRQGLPRDLDDLEARGRALDIALLEPDRTTGAGARLGADLLVNDLEPAAQALCPAIADALQAVRETGADHALVCGSGPTVAGLFWGEDGDARAALAADALRDRFPEAAAVAPVSSRG